MESVFNALGELAHRAFHLAINGIWPGLLLTLLVWTGWRFVRSATAASRYLVWWGVLLTCLLSPLLVAGVVNMPDFSALAPEVSPASPDAVLIPTSTAGGYDLANLPVLKPHDYVAVPPAAPLDPEPSFRWINLAPLALLAIWLVVAAVLTVRLARAFAAVRRIKRRSRAFDQSRLSDYLLRMLAGGTRRGAVAVRSSSEILSPVAAGLGRPTILIPDRIASELSDSELKAVILHELSHLRRWDDVTKLCQKILEALFFFHPAVFWIGRELELERELACDEWAVAHTGTRDDYARCLTRLVQLTHGCATTLIPGVLSGRNQIFKRFQRLLLGERLASGRFQRARLTGVLSIIAGMFLLVVHFVPAIAAPFDIVTLDDLQYAWSGPSANPEKDSDHGRLVLSREEAEALFAREVEAQRAYEAALAAEADGTRAEIAARGDELKAYAVARADAARALAAVRADRARASSGSRTFYLGGSRSGRAPIAYRAASGTYSVGNEKGNTNSVSTDDGRTISMQTKGETIFTRDLTDIKSITPEGYFDLTETDDDVTHHLRVESDKDGALTYHYEVGGRPQDFDAAGQEWLADRLTHSVELRTGSARSKGGVRWYSYDDDVPVVETYSGDKWFDAGDVAGVVSVGDFYDVGDGVWNFSNGGDDDLPTAGTWRANARGSRGRIELRFRGDGSRSQYTLLFLSSQFQGWKDEWIEGDDPKAHFEYVADAGTISFDGDFRNGRGRGDYSFRMNEDFRDFLIKYGCRRSELTDGRLLSLLIYEVNRAFVTSLEEAGFSNLSLDELIELRIHGADAEYLKALKEVGYGDIGRGRLVEFLVHGVTPDDIREFQNSGYQNLSPADLVAFRIHDVSPEFLKDCKEAGFGNLSADRLVEFRIHDVDPRDLAEFRESGYDHLSPSDMVTFRIHDISPEYLKECVEAGCKNISPDQLVAFGIHDVEPYDIRGFVGLGYKDLRASDYIDFAIHDVSPGFVEELAELGYKDLPPDRLLDFRMHGVTPGFIKRAQKRAGKDLSAEELLEMKVIGW